MHKKKKSINVSLKLKSEKHFKLCLDYMFLNVSPHSLPSWFPLYCQFVITRKYCKLEENGRSRVYVLSEAQSISDPWLFPSIHWVETLIPQGGTESSGQRMCYESLHSVGHLSVFSRLWLHLGAGGETLATPVPPPGAVGGPGAHPWMDGWMDGRTALSPGWGMGRWPLRLDTT